MKNNKGKYIKTPFKEWKEKHPDVEDMIGQTFLIHEFKVISVVGGSDLTQIHVEDVYQDDRGYVILCNGKWIRLGPGENSLVMHLELRVDENTISEDLFKKYKIAYEDKAKPVQPWHYPPYLIPEYYVPKYPNNPIMCNDHSTGRPLERDTNTIS